jgi:hypothetical protein
MTKITVTAAALVMGLSTPALAQYYGNNAAAAAQAAQAAQAAAQASQAQMQAMQAQQQQQAIQLLAPAPVVVAPQPFSFNNMPRR